jgi:uncharacterized protein YukJ
MPIPKYGVLTGRPLSRKVSGPPGKPPHLHIRLQAAGAVFDIAVNVLSTDGSEILYHVNHAFTPPVPADLLALQPGRTLLPNNHPLALDFVRQQLVTREEMILLSADDAQHLTASDLHNELDDLVARAIHDSQARLLAFGSEYDGGIHDIHMNQGNPLGSEFAKDNGIHQDGALLAYFPADSRWLGAFLAYQSQSWTTDDHGNPRKEPP